MKSRKNKKILVAVAMVLMIALVAGMGAMTYSKYITTSSAPSQTATAAKWNYVVSADATNLFGAAYKEGNADTVATTNEEGIVVVQASSTANVVAPGTSGSMAITVNGESQVLAQFKMTMTCTEIECADYAPIKWTLKKGDGTLVADDVTLTEFLTALNAQTVKATWDATAEAYKFATAYTISWEWALTDPIDAATQTTCMYDTLIGYKAADAEWASVQHVIGATGETFAAFATAEGVNYEEDIVTTMTIEFSATIEQVQA